MHLLCGAADHTPTPEPAVSADPTEVQSGVNVCPRFDGSLVMPQRIAPSVASVITVECHGSRRTGLVARFFLECPEWYIQLE